MKSLGSLFFLLISILFPMKSYSQEIPLSLEDLIPGGKTYSKYRAEMPRRVSWAGDKLTYVKGDSIMIAPNTEKETAQVLLTVKDINANSGLGEGETVKSLTYVQFVSATSNNLMIVSPEKIYLYDFVNKKLAGTFSSTEKMENHDLSDKSNNLAYTVENNLFVQTPDGKK